MTNEGFLGKDGTDFGALTAAFRACGARLACICSSDAVYAKEAQPAARALAKAGAKSVWIAGRASTNDGELRQAGVNTFIFPGCDVPTILESAYRQISGTA